MKKLGFVAMAMAALCFAGCKHTEAVDPEVVVTEAEEEVCAKDGNTYAVVVGMEYSRFAGACPGAGLDSERIRSLLNKYTANVVHLRDATATKERVVMELSSAISKAGSEGLVVFYYSGHGGSEPFPDTGVEETDGSDEYYCLYDTYLRDNDLWNIISKSKSRVFIINDCCHSKTLYRTPMIKINPPLAWDQTLNEKQPFSMLCWSGCPDDTYSYGSSTGGQFTNALLRHFAANKTYEYLWDEIKKDKTLRAYENPQSTVLGNGFMMKRIFK